MFVGAYERLGGSDVKLLQAISEQRELVYEFPEAGFTATLHSKAPGRRFVNTGVAIWQASFVLAEWLSRKRFCQDLGELTSDWGFEQCTSCVELGAGLGLPSLVSAHLGLQTIATDGDQSVVTLLEENLQLNGLTAKMSVQSLTWGEDTDPVKTLALSRPPDLLLAADVVYGNDRRIWDGLLATILGLSGRNTLLVMAQVKRYASFDEGEGKFFEQLSQHFDSIVIPSALLHPDFRREKCLVIACRLKHSVGTSETIGRKKRKRRDSEAQ